MCDTAPNHNTGWKVVRATQKEEWMTGKGWSWHTWLSLMCRTRNCIETRIEKRAGYWTVRDFE